MGAERVQMTGSPLRGALLALLLSEPPPAPLGGYRLATLVERRLGPAWKVTRQSVYGALERLEDDGIIRSTSRVATSRRGGQRLYEPTERAAGALDAWMRSPVSKDPVRVELQARIAVSRACHAPFLLDALQSYERECFEMLRRTKEAEVPVGSWTALATNLTRAAVDEGIQAELRWVAVARRWIEEFMSEHGEARRSDAP